MKKFLVILIILIPLTFTGCLGAIGRLINSDDGGDDEVSSKKSTESKTSSTKDSTSKKAKKI